MNQTIASGRRYGLTQTLLVPRYLWSQRRKRRVWKWGRTLIHNHKTPKFSLSMIGWWMNDVLDNVSCPDCRKAGKGMLCEPCHDFRSIK